MFKVKSLNALNTCVFSLIGAYSSTHLRKAIKFLSEKKINLMWVDKTWNLNNLNNHPKACQKPWLEKIRNLRSDGVNATFCGSSSDKVRQRAVCASLANELGFRQQSHPKGVNCSVNWLSMYSVRWALETWLGTTAVNYDIILYINWPFLLWAEISIVHVLPIQLLFALMTRYLIEHK